MCLCLGSLFTEPSNNYYALDSTNDWNAAQQYGPGPVGPQPSQQYGIIQNMEPHQIAPNTSVSGNLALFDTVSSPSNSISSLPPISTFTNRPPQVTPGYSSVISSAPSMVTSPQPIDIKPDITSLYSMTNEQANQQWSMRRSPPVVTPLQPTFSSADVKPTNEITHLHTMVRSLIKLTLSFFIITFWHLRNVLFLLIV